MDPEVELLDLHLNPFDLAAHLEDEHDMTSWVIDQMDSDQLRRTHEVIHRRGNGISRGYRGLHAHIDPDLA